MTTPQLCQQLAIQHPIIQAPMAGGLTTPELISAVSNEGALGSLGAGYMPAEAMEQALAQINKRTGNPYAVNLFIPSKINAESHAIAHMQSIVAQAPNAPPFKNVPPKPPYLPDFHAQMEVVLAHKVPVFSFTFGELSAEYTQKLHANGTFIIGTATSVNEAKRLQENKVDAVCVQGYEAGGHRGAFLHDHTNNKVGNLALIPQVADQLAIPVIAAGGIMDARGLNAVLTLGASAAQIGTGFLLCQETKLNPTYLSALINQTADNTVLTKCFSGKEARGINNQFIDYMQAHAKHFQPYPIQNAITRELRNAASLQRNAQCMSLWAGQGAPMASKNPITVKQYIASLTQNSL